MRTNHRRLLFALAAAAAVAAVGHARSTQTSSRTEVDRLLSRWTRSTPGCAVGADVKGAPVIRAAYGMADLEHDTPITLDTIFEAGSVSKQFTATAVLLLARDGKLSLDDPVRKYIPELHSSTDAVTIRQMLHHTSGLRDWGSLVAVAGWPRGTRIHTQAHVLDVLGRQRALNFPPGTQWSYSNSNYNLAAILVSRVSGMSFADFTRTRIFEPLGMTDTSWRDDFTRIVKRRAIAYSEQQQGRFSISMPFENVYGNAALLTTINDLLKWNANFRRPIVGDGTLIDELQRRAVLSDGRSHEYALGLYVDTYRGVREVDHSGGTAGYRAHLGRYPDQQVSVAVLCNVTSADPTNYAKTVAALFLTGLQTPTSPSPSHLLTRAEAERLAGLYRSRLPVGASNVVYTDQGGLSIQNLGRLVATSATRFLMDGGYQFEFNTSGMRSTDEFGTVVIYDRVEPARPSADQLKEYAGRYFSEEVETTLDLVVDGSTLVIRRRPDFTQTLTPVFADGFISGALGWVVFRRDRSGRVEEFSISQDRLWGLAFTR